MRELANQTGHDLEAMPSTRRGEAKVFEVPLRAATPAALRGFGRLVAPGEPAAVTIVRWPQHGRRPVVAGTGVGGGTVRGRFAMERRGGRLYASNHAVRRHYITGWFGDPAEMGPDSVPEHPDAILTHEANYHPDGGQLFVPMQPLPFVALLAPPGDDVTPASFVAFHFDGTHGIHIDPGVWHEPLFPLAPRMSFDDEQGAVHACVSVDFVGEFGGYLRVPLGNLC